MAVGGRICPHCKRYTAKEARCIYCNHFLGPEWLVGIQRVLAENGLLATNLLAGVCVLVFFGEVVVSMATVKPTPSVMSFVFFSGVDWRVMMRFGALGTGLDVSEPWRMLTACFLHYGLLHLGMNMMALFDFGRALEPKIKWPRFMVGFIVTGVFGFAVSTWWYGGVPYSSAGASGAVFGVQGLLLGQMLAAKDKAFMSFLWRTVAYSMIFYFAMRTNQAAHMGGLAAGIGLGYLYGLEKRPWHRERIFTVLAIALFAFSVGSLVYAQVHYEKDMRAVLERHALPDDD